MPADAATPGQPTWWRPILIVAVFAALPFAVFLNDNRAEAELDAELVLYALAVFALGLLALVTADRLRGPVARERAAVLFAVVSFAFFHFGIARELAGLAGFSEQATGATLLAWLLLAAAAIWVAVRVSAHREAWNYFALAGVLLLALPVVQYAFKDTAPEAAVADVYGEEVQAADPPDVYFFLLDGYGRADQLEATVGYDNSAFLRSLERRGFEVHENATAAYPVTFLSLASTLQMGYPAEPGDLDDYGPFFNAIEGDNETVETFHHLGYEFAFATDYSSLECGEEVDLCLEPDRDLVDELIGEREIAILGATPMAEVLPAVGIHSSPLSGYVSPEEVVEEVERERSGNPVFVYSHILAPHPPYRYDEECELKDEIRDPSLIYWEEADGTGGEGYRQALECINRELLAAVDTLPENAIVVIQGDHGPKFGIDFHRPLSDWTESELQQRFPILNAQRLPRDCPAGAGAALAVNTFRYVFGCITGEPPEPLPRRELMVDLEAGRIEPVE